MSLRDLCRCGHVRNSHPGDGPCRTASGTCSCGSWSPAFPVFDSALPVGVTALRDYRSGLTLVECSHADATVRCSFCKGDAQTTDGYRLRVKRLAFAPRELALL